MKRIHYYITCENCGANLDPGEKCDCTTDKSNDSFEKSAGSEECSPRMIEEPVVLPVLCMVCGEELDPVDGTCSTLFCGSGMDGIQHADNWCKAD